MGIYDRDYIRGDNGYSAPARKQPVPVVKWLLGLNIAVFVVDHVFLGAATRSRFSMAFWGSYDFARAIGEWQVWRFFTYQFLHAGFFHLVANMMGLYFFGPLAEKYWGRWRFLAFYLFCGVSGALVMSALSLAHILPTGQHAQLVGASGSIFGILICAAMVYPDLMVQLIIPPVTLRMRTFALTLLGISAGVILLGWENAGGHAAHLGGALLGFGFMRNPQWLNPFKRGIRIALARQVAPGSTPSPPPSPGQSETSRLTREEIDRVLDKISAKGIHSLTDAERKILDRARQDLR